MHGGEIRTPILQSPDRGAHCLRHVEKLEIHEHLLVLRDEPVDEIEITIGHEQLQAELVEAHGVAEAFNRLSRRLRACNVKRVNEAFPDRDLFSREVMHVLLVDSFMFAACRLSNHQARCIHAPGGGAIARRTAAVSYTHLTLPTIYSV